MEEKEKIALSNLQKISNLIHKGCTDYIFLGLLLKESEYWFRDLPGRNYKDIYDFAKNELNLCRTNVKYYIGVQKRFGQGMQLKNEYKDYLFSQLREMYNLKDEQLKLCNPQMSVASIKALKKTGKKTDKEKLDDYVGKQKEVYFKNDTELASFLADYKNWQLFHSIPELTLKFYKAMLTNGCWIVATESEVVQTWKDNSIVYNVKYTLMSNSDICRYSYGSSSITSLCEYLRADQVGYLRI